jgi:hypothetical protein
MSGNYIQKIGMHNYDRGAKLQECFRNTKQELGNLPPLTVAAVPRWEPETV